MVGKIVGLLGGSFNPAHAGHRHISVMALRYLKLDEVWWLVSPQNPLKSAQNMAQFEDRMAFAREISRHARIKVSDFEHRVKTQYTVETIAKLKECHPKHRFVWLIGADNLIQIPAWRRWQDLFDALPIAVFDRAPYSYKALSGRAARYYRQARHKRSHGLARQQPPAWCYMWTARNRLSATRLRKVHRETAVPRALSAISASHKDGDRD